MKKFIYSIMLVVLFFILPTNISAYEAYMESSDVLLISPIKFEIITRVEDDKPVTVGYSSNPEIGVFAHRYHRVTGPNIGLTSEHLGEGIENGDIYRVEKYDEELELNTIDIYFYSGDYIYRLRFYSEEINQNLYNLFSRIASDSKYQYKEKINPTYQVPVQKPSETDGNIIPDDDIEKVVELGSKSSALKSDNLIKIVGTLILSVLAIMALAKKKLSVINIIGIVLIVIQMGKYFTVSGILVSGSRVELLYVLFYFIPGIAGVILCSKEGVLEIKNNDVIKNIIETPTISNVDNNPTETIKPIPEISIDDIEIIDEVVKPKPITDMSDFDSLYNEIIIDIDNNDKQ